MSIVNLAGLPEQSIGLQLHRIDAKRGLISCECVIFDRGVQAVELVLRRASICGLVRVGGPLFDYFADVLNESGDMIQSIALDSSSYKSLKTKWMRCKVQVQP